MSQPGGGPPVRAFTGGLWSADGSAIWPLARLELSGWGIGVRSSTRVLRWLVPAWDARYEDIAGAQRVLVPIANRGVYIRTLSGAGQIVFWTRRGADVLDHLQLHGVPVDWSIGQVPWAVHLDHHP